jgi:hypothetical protein
VLFLVDTDDDVVVVQLTEPEYPPEVGCRPAARSSLVHNTIRAYYIIVYFVDFRIMYRVRRTEISLDLRILE